MKHELVVLWQIHDKARSVVDALLEGLKKPAAAHPNKFSLEAKKLMDELAALVNATFNPSFPEKIQELPPEYQQVIFGLAQAAGLQDRIIRFREDDAFKYMGRLRTDLRTLAEGKQNHRDGITRVLRICGALALECRMACVVPEEVVLNEVDIGAVIHVENL